MTARTSDPTEPDQLDLTARLEYAEEHWAPAQVRARARARGLARIAFGIVEGSAPAEVAARDAALRRALAAANVLALVVTLGVAVPLASADVLRAPALLLIAVVVLAAAGLRLQSNDELTLCKHTLSEAPALLQLSSIATAALLVGERFFVSGSIGVFQGLAIWFGLPAVALVCRGALRRLAVAQGEPERCLVIAQPSCAEDLARRFALESTTLARVVATVSPEELPPGQAGRAVVLSFIRQEHIHRLIIASPELDTELVLELIRDMKAIGVKTSVRPRLLDVIGSAVAYDDVGGTVFLGLRRFGLSRTQRRLKRGVDVVGSVAGLVVLSPLLALIAGAIRLDSRGPVLFRQTRVGRDGKPFEIVKFRTMVVDAEERKASLRAASDEPSLFKLRDDPRVTRVGRWLRRTSLDELPQLLNVVRGEMSLVGPRPLVLDEDDHIRSWHRRRLQLVPGMTGVWQVLGTDRLPLQEMVALDYLYIVNWSVWGDVQTLVGRLPTSCGGGGCDVRSCRGSHAPQTG